MGGGETGKGAERQDRIIQTTNDAYDKYLIFIVFLYVNTHKCINQINSTL